MVSVEVILTIIGVIIGLLGLLTLLSARTTEGFQSGSVHVSFDDGSGNPNSNATANRVVGGGYNIQPMDHSPMSGTAAGAGSPLLTLKTYTPPLADVVLPKGSRATKGILYADSDLPAMELTRFPSYMMNQPLPTLPSMNVQVLKSGKIPIGDAAVGSYASEDETSMPSFTVAASKLDKSKINKVKSKLASGAQYKMIVTSDLSGAVYIFPLATIDILSGIDDNVYAYNFQNQAVIKEGPTFFGARVLQFEIIQTGSSSKTKNKVSDSTNAKPIPAECKSSLKHQGVYLYTPPVAPSIIPGRRAPTPPNAISSEPPSTMASILPATATVSPINEYTFTNQSIMMDVSTLAQRIRSGELEINCNIIS
jgi:hypothetical protein